MDTKERVLVGAIELPDTDHERFLASLDELNELVQTAQGEVIEIVTQKRNGPSPSFYFGKGKMEEIKQIIEEKEIEILIINGDLSPSQSNNLSKYFDLRVIDRTQLILDIFAQRARTREGKLQVELAQYQYMLPRLAGQGIALSRLGAGIGTRGPGETKLETDRRHIRRRIDELKAQIQSAATQRNLYRSRRKRNQAFQIALVGYTNAGKSTIFNQITSSNTLEENQLFATLDPLTRMIRLPSGFQVLLTDTVGFIEDLPTSLVAAFRSTLEEVKEADLLLSVVDASHPDHTQHEKTVQKHLKELDAEHLPMLTVYNKMDKVMDFVPYMTPAIQISARNKKDIISLTQRIEESIKEICEPYEITLASDQGKLMTKLKRESLVTESTFDEEEELYKYKGYIPKDHALYSWLENGEVERELNE